MANPCKAATFFSSADSTFHSGFGGTQAFNHSRVSASRLSSCIPLEYTANTEKPRPLHFSFAQFYFGTFITFILRILIFFAPMTADMIAVIVNN